MHILPGCLHYCITNLQVYVAIISLFQLNIYEPHNLPGSRLEYVECMLGGALAIQKSVDCDMPLQARDQA